MKIVRSEGQSYTTADNTSDDVLRRGLVRSRNRVLTPASYRERFQINPGQLSSYLRDDYRLVIRQVISILDKVITKPRNLGQYQVDAYVDRTLLAAELWKLLEEKCGADVRRLGPDALKEFEASWQWKVHPYAKHPSNSASPATDDNAKFIRTRSETPPKQRSSVRKIDTTTAARSDFNGRWHDAFWKQTDGRPDYKRIAEAIWTHLFDKELKIDGKDRNKSKVDQTTGLIAGRGQSISTSAHSPLPSASKNHDRRGQLLKVLADRRARDLYFREDVVQKIAAAVQSTVLNTSQNQNSAALSAMFGAKLYEHFGEVLKRTQHDKAVHSDLWALHNSIRKFYRELANSTRLRLAVSGATRDPRKAEQLVPQNHGALIRILKAKARNADISTYIRLGKLIAHASDIPAETKDAQQEFVARLQRFATSEGQNEIKRNEAFTRIWRTSVALSLRTLQVLAPVNRGDGQTQRFNDDPASGEYAKTAAKQIKPTTSEHRDKLSLIFGNKRSEFLLSGVKEHRARKDVHPNQEIVWALLRLTAVLRNGTNHFNTKRRLIRLLQSGALSSRPYGRMENFDSRSINEVADIALDAFRQLLEFDIGLQRQIVLDEFQRLKVHEYVSASNIDDLFAELTRTPDRIGLTTPKFMSVLQHAHNAGKFDEANSPEWVRPFIRLDLANLSKQTHGANQFVVGILRHLYATGFPAWLAERQDKTNFVKAAVEAVVQFKKRRVASFLEQEKSKGRQRFYAMIEAAAESLAVDDKSTLDGMLAELHSRAMSEDAIRRTYRAEPQLQRDRANWVGEFKLDLFAFLFASYVHDRNMDWLWCTENTLPEHERVAPERLSAYSRSGWGVEIKPWHSQFYVWLYLVPSDEVALLRHQFRKTHALEQKAGAGDDNAVLVEIDRLMGLYLGVCSAGFTGTEHERLAGGAANVVGRDRDTTDLVTLLKEDLRLNHAVLPGTNRGLRQFLSLGTHRPLDRILQKHPVTEAEIDALKEFLKHPNRIEEKLSERKRLAKEIQNLAKSRNADQNALRALSQSYSKLAVDIAIYNYRISGARLRDHARLHQLMMRVLGRLLDFSLIWERDRQYAYLGMLYRQLQKQAPKTGYVEDVSATDRTPAGTKLADPVAVDIRWDDDTHRTKLGFDLPQPFKHRLSAAYPEWVQSDRRSKETNITASDVERGFLPIWGEDRGFVLDGDRVEINLLDDENRRLFDHYFVRAREENPKDIEADERRRIERERRIAAGADVPPQSQSGFRNFKAKIRNDFAHFNMLEGKRSPNLTYLTNSIRSLLSYDRKLKNAVSQSISDILADEGLIIRWKLIDDRLKHPVVMPVLIRHLDFVKTKTDQPVAFGLPKVSLRFTSMVMALFNFSSGGYRAEIAVGDKKTASGELRFPTELWASESIMRMAIPEEIRNLTYPPLPER